MVHEVLEYEANGIDASSLDYTSLVALLIEGVKEQRQIDKMKSERRTPTP